MPPVSPTNQSAPTLPVRSKKGHKILIAFVVFVLIFILLVYIGNKFPSNEVGQGCQHSGQDSTIFTSPPEIDQSKSESYLSYNNCVVFLTEKSERTYFDYMTEADPTSFKILASRYAADKNNVYYQRNILKGISPEILKSLDQSTLVFGQDGTIKDKDNVYLYGIKVNNADPSSFGLMSFPAVSNYESVFPNTMYYQDKNYIYALQAYIYSGFNQVMKINQNASSTFQVVRMDNVDKASIVYDYAGVASDKNHVYFYGKIIPNSTPGSFQGYGSYYYRSGSEIYYLNPDDPSLNPPISTDTNNFHILSGSYYGYAVDSNDVFYQGQLLQGVNPKGFHFVESTSAISNPDGVIPPEDIGVDKNGNMYYGVTLSSKVPNK